MRLFSKAKPRLVSSNPHYASMMASIGYSEATMDELDANARMFEVDPSVVYKIVMLTRKHFGGQDAANAVLFSKSDVTDICIKTLSYMKAKGVAIDYIHDMLIEIEKKAA